MGAVLQQDDGKGLRVVGYGSKVLTEAEQKWTVREQEAYAIVWGIEHFIEYLITAPSFKVRTDHESLKWLWALENNRRIARWGIRLQEYNFEIEYRAGKWQQHVDVFSRDVKPDTDEEKTLETISITPTVFAVEGEVIRSLENIPTGFPTVEQLPTLVEEEIRMKDREVPNNLHIEDGIYLTANDKIYVPKKVRQIVLQYFHFSSFGGHPGIVKMTSRMRRHFYWNQMQRDVEKLVQKCLTCTRRRVLGSDKRKEHFEVAQPGDMLALDIFGPVLYRGESKHFFTMVEHFTRYARVVEVPNTLTAMGAWNVVYQEWITSFGCPQSILTDNGGQFVGPEFRKLCAGMQIQKIYSSLYYPQGNGIVESFHQFLKRALMKKDTESKRNNRGVDELEVGDVVVKRYNEGERAKLVKEAGGSKMVPEWSRPFRIVCFLDSQKHKVRIRSIADYFQATERVVSAKHLIKIPRTLEPIPLLYAKCELTADMNRKTWQEEKESQVERRKESMTTEDQRILAEDLANFEDAVREEQSKAGYHWKEGRDEEMG